MDIQDENGSKRIWIQYRMKMGKKNNMFTGENEWKEYGCRIKMNKKMDIGWKWNKKNMDIGWKWI